MRIPNFFSARYKEKGDLTVVKVLIELRNEIETLKKKFKEFTFEIESIYVGPAIDEKPHRIRLCIKTRSKRFHFARENRLRLELDDGPIEFPSANRSSQLRGRKARENLCWDIDKALVNDFAKSRKFDFTVGGLRIELLPDHVKLLTDYSKLLAVSNESL